MNRPAIRRSIRAFALAVAAFGAASGAQAQSYSAASAKSSAILGGASRLAQITAQQQGQVLSAANAFAPSNKSGLPLRRAVLNIYEPRPRPRVAWTGRPDLFGSVALKIERTPLDQRWNMVAHAPLPRSASSASRAFRHLGDAEIASAVNRYVNARVSFVDDQRQYGRRDLWSAASDTLRRGRGDCEDYALAKMQMLRAAGIPSKNIYFVLVRDLVRMADHAVLVVHADGRNLMLDNSTDEVLDADAVRDYRPVFTFASTGTWTHGYRRQRARALDWAAANLPATAAGY